MKNKKLTAKYLKKKGFDLIDKSESPFSDFDDMDYFVKNGVLLFFNTPVTKCNENDFYIGYAEMRWGNYHAVTFRWINEKKDVIDIYKAITGLDIQTDI